MIDERGNNGGMILSVEQRLKELEQATAVAYLNSISPDKWSDAAEKVKKARSEGKHFRLVVVDTGDGDVVADIEVMESDAP